jgi:glutamyl-tRNA synthetase
LAISTRRSGTRCALEVVRGPIAPVIAEPAFTAEAAAALPAPPWTNETWAAWTNDLKVRTGRKGKDLFMPLRLALTAADHGPEMKALLPMIGPKRAQALLSGEKA